MATPTQTVPHLTGPYDGWVLETGREYDFARLYPDSYGVGLHLSGVVEGDVDPTAPIMVDHADGQTSSAIAPVMWMAGGPMRFTPVLMGDPMGTTPPAGHANAGHLGWRPGFPLATPMIATTTSDLPAGAHPAVDPSRPIVIAACIDDGIAFANDRFTSDGLSRIDYCWTMSAAAPENSTVAFGRETTADQIDGLRAAHAGDEDALYQAAGVLGGGVLPRSGLRHPVTHGAHVLDLLTGGEADSNTRIIAVDLPTTATWDTSGFGKDMYVLAALHYIFERADRIAEAYGKSHLPVVLNISYGTSGGPHDGSAVIEAAMDELITARRNLAPTALVMPSGNMHLDRLSARITPDHRAAAAPLNWRVQPSDGTSSYVELWLPAGCAPGDFEVTIEGPRGTCSVTATGSTNAQIIPLAVDGKVIGQVQTGKARGGRGLVHIALAPTQVPKDDKPTAPAGLWQITVAGPASGNVEARIQRDVDYGGGSAGARQSYFDQPDYQSYDDTGAPQQTDNDCMVQRHGSLNGMATGQTALTVGGIIGAAQRPAPATGHPAAFSSASLMGDESVDLCAIVDRSVERVGVVASGTRNGSRAVLRGTSMAAPQAGRSLITAFHTIGTNLINGTAASNYLGLIEVDPDWIVNNETGVLAARIGKGALKSHSVALIS